MPVTRAFLKPITVQQPPQGDYEYIPEVHGYEGSTLTELINQMNLGVGVLSLDLENYYVVEDVQYETTVLAQELGMQPAVVK